MDVLIMRYGSFFLIAHENGSWQEREKKTFNVEFQWTEEKKPSWIKEIHNKVE